MSVTPVRQRSCPPLPTAQPWIKKRGPDPYNGIRLASMRQVVSQWGWCRQLAFVFQIEADWLVKARDFADVAKCDWQILICLFSIMIFVILSCWHAVLSNSVLYVQCLKWMFSFFGCSLLSARCFLETNLFQEIHLLTKKKRSIHVFCFQV